MMQQSPWRNTFGLLFAVITSPLLGTPAIAQTSLLKTLELCEGSGGVSLDGQMEACTTVVQTPAVRPRGLSVAHNNRGTGYVKKGEYDSAIQDFDQAIKINPNYVKALNNRGVAYQKKGEIDRSIQDFDAAIKL